MRPGFGRRRDDCNKPKAAFFAARGAAQRRGKKVLRAGRTGAGSAAFEASRGTGYEVLLYNCMVGDATLFSRSDLVETAWRTSQPILDAWKKLGQVRLPTYEAGSSGPSESAAMLERDGRKWRPIGNASPDHDPWQIRRRDTSRIAIGIPPIRAQSRRAGGCPNACQLFFLVVRPDHRVVAGVLDERRGGQA